MHVFSLNYNIKELVPIGGLEPAEAHGQPFDLFYHLIIYLIFFLLLLFLWD